MGVAILHPVLVRILDNFKFNLIQKNNIIVILVTSIVRLFKVDKKLDPKKRVQCRKEVVQTLRRREEEDELQRRRQEQRGRRSE
jgi:hypothetical protein